MEMGISPRNLKGQLYHTENNELPDVNGEVTERIILGHTLPYATVTIDLMLPSK